MIANGTINCDKVSVSLRVPRRIKQPPVETGFKFQKVTFIDQLDHAKAQFDKTDVRQKKG